MIRYYGHPDHDRWRFRKITIESLDAEVTIDLLGDAISIPRALSEEEIQIATKWMQKQLARAE